MFYIELMAVALGLICVWLTVRQHIACWPVGLAMVSLYLLIFYRARLYSDMLLQAIYIVLQIYGWRAWLRGGPGRTNLAVGRLPRSQILPWSAVSIGGTLGLGFVMDRFTDAALPYADAFTTVSSLIAQWLLGRKRLESWIVWIAVDVVSIGVYLARNLHLTAGLYAVFLVLAAQGYLTWRRALHAPATA